VELFDRYGLSHHLFADDTSAPPQVSFTIAASVSSCIHELHEWCALCMLQLNPAKTELIIFEPRATIRQLKPYWDRSILSFSQQMSCMSLASYSIVSWLWRNMSTGYSQHLFLPSSTITAAQTSCLRENHKTTGVYLRFQSPRLLQRYTTVNHQPSTTYAECRCTAHTWFLFTWPYESSTEGAPLATSRLPDLVQSDIPNVYGSRQSPPCVPQRIRCICQ